MGPAARKLSFRLSVLPMSRIFLHTARSTGLHRQQLHPSSRHFGPAASAFRVSLVYFRIWPL